MTSKTMLTNYRCPLRASNPPHSTDSSLLTATFPILHPITEGLSIHTIKSRPPKANFTVQPSMTPICLIQHRAHTFPSLYRSAQVDLRGSAFTVQVSFRSCRLLVDWYTVATGVRPIVLDDDDLIHRSVTTKQFCDAVSIIVTEVQTSWGATSQAEIRGQDTVTSAIDPHDTDTQLGGAEQKRRRRNSCW